MGFSQRPDWGEFAARFGTEEADEADYLKPPPVVQTGFASLDWHLAGGLRPGPHVLMAPPGFGKSALALNVALNVALAGGRVLICSIEMTRQQCIARLSSCLSADPRMGLEPVSWAGWESGGRKTAKARYDAMRSFGEAEGVEAVDADPRVRAMRRLREVAPGLAIADGREIASCTALKATARDGRRAGMCLMVIDYLQRLAPPDGLEAADSVRRTAETSMAVTGMGKELGLPILVVSQMSREAARSGKPSLFAAKGSGDVEQDALSVSQLIRTGEITADGSRGVAMHVLKARAGITTDEAEPMRLCFDGKHGRFVEWD